MSSFCRIVTFATGLMALGSVRSAAQHPSPIHSGGWIISGSGAIGRSHQSDFDANMTHIAIRPSGLVFLNDHFALGASVPLSYTDGGGSLGHSFSYGLGPTARYYFIADTSRWLPFVGAAIEPQWLRVHREVTILTGGGAASNVSQNSNGRDLSYDASAGVTRLLADHVGLTGELYYTHTELTGDLANNQTLRSYDVGARFGLTVFVH